MRMAMDLKTYAGVTAVIGVVIGVQIVGAQGSLGLILTLSLLNAFVAALFSMGLKYEPGKAVAFIWLTPLAFTSAFVLGMLTA
jgi:hypothetical protein